MTPAECNYPIHDKELLAVVAATKEWHSDLRSTRKFEVVTDHKNLEYFQKKQRLSERQVRWVEHLEGLPLFYIQHRPGKLNAASDALSRREQDIPVDAEDERLKDRELQLLKEGKALALTVHPIPLTFSTMPGQSKGIAKQERAGRPRKHGTGNGFTYTRSTSEN